MDPVGPVLVELIVTVGVGEPDVESWSFVNSNTSLLQGVPKQSGPPPVTIHKSPEESKTSCAPPLVEIVTVGAGLAVASSALENSTTLVSVDTHRSPAASKASESGVLGKSEIVVTGVARPRLPIGSRCTRRPGSKRY